jgi:rsbT co-antagonist protein RsbR
MNPTPPSGAAPLPFVGAEQQAAMREFWQVTEPHRQAIADEARAELGKIPFVAVYLKTMTREQQAEQEKRSNELQRRALVEGDWAPYVADLRAQAEGFARAGIPFSAWLPLFTLSREIVRRTLVPEIERQGARALRALDGLNYFLDLAISELGQAYLETKEKLIGQQQAAIRELSTPILQLSEGLLILPVVGLVDTQRARHLTETLLVAIRNRRARAVVMDITGVPVVDSKVANHLVQACEAARLMGAQVILTGISPEIAQALVTIGAELHGARTLADLQSGIEEANRILARRTVPAPGAPQERS